MRYTDHRHKIKSGDLIAFRARGFWGWLICLWTWSAYSHVGVAVWIFERLFLIEAKEGVGVRMEPLSKRGAFDHIRTEAHFDDAVGRDALMFLGKSYNYLDLARVGLKLRPKGDGFICSEFAAKIIRPVDQDIWTGIPRSPTPANLAAYYIKHFGPATEVTP